MFYYVKAIHIIFIVTWFAGLFYIPRLYVYLAETEQKSEPEKTILRTQLMLMTKRLWYGITWPSALLTLILGGWVWWLYPATPGWLWVKLALVAGLYLYHFSLQHIFNQFYHGKSTYTSYQMRIWNEVATLFLVAIVILVVVKNNVSLLYGAVGLLIFIALLMLAIRVYKTVRDRTARKL